MASNTQRGERVIGLLAIGTLSLLVVVCVWLATYIWNQRGRSASVAPTPAVVDEAAAMSQDTAPSRSFEEWAQYEPRAGFRGSAYDLVVYLCVRDGRVLSIDPDVLADLAKIRVSLTEDEMRQSAVELLNPVLLSSQFRIYSAPLVTNTAVDYVTSPALLTYVRAVQALHGNQLERAYALLSSLPNDAGGGFAEHCEGLGKAVKALIELEARFRSFDQILTRSTQALTGSANAQNARSRAAIGGVVANQTISFWDTFESKCRPIVERLVDANNSGLTGEVLFIANRLRWLVDWTSKIEKKLVMAGMLDSKVWRTTVQDASLLGNLHDEARKVVTKARASTQAALPLSRASDARQHQRLACAMSLDPTMATTRISLGYLAVKDQVDSIVSYLLNATSSVERVLSEVQDEHDSSKDGSIWASAIARRGREKDGFEYEPRTIVGTANGLLVSVGQGSVGAFMVGVEKMDPAKVTMKSVIRQGVVVQLYDSIAYKDVGCEFSVEQYQRAPMFYFSQYGQQFGDLMWLSAHQACLWLKGVVPTQYQDNVMLRIAPHDLLSSMDGDSAGVAVALAGYSALGKIALRRDVAVTGSVRSDGCVKAVGGITAKALGALLSDGVSVVVVPEENESDLMVLPVSHLTRQILVLGDTMDTYLQYTVANNAGAQLLATANALIDFRVGDWDSAYRQFQMIAEAHPEIYNARRLLEYMRIYGKMDCKTVVERVVGADSWASDSISRPPVVVQSAAVPFCSSCAGNGFFVCTKCEGRGSTQVMKDVTCRECNGYGVLQRAGFQQHKCPRCNGSGHRMSYEWVCCDTCAGVGVLVCSRCGGVGIVE